MLDVVPAEGDVLFGVVVFVVADMVRSYRGFVGLWVGIYADLSG